MIGGCQLFKRLREDIALICNLGALVLALVLVLGGVRDLFNTIKALFPLYGG